MAAPIRVLYVDDDPFLLDIGKLFLEQSGEFSVMTALSAQEALRLIEQETFDTIVSDYQMPGMDGIQFLVEVRTRFGMIPFILFTGRGREEVVIQAINSGVDFYLQKGGEPEAQFADLMQKIQSAVFCKRADDALRKSEERYRTIYDQSPVAIELYDTVGALVHVNPACLRLFGIEDIQFIQNFSLFADPNITDEQKEKLHRGETVHYQGSFDFEKVKDLNLYPTCREGTIWLDVLIVPTGNRSDSITGFFVQIQDITERKLAEEALEKSEAQYRHIIENIQDMVYRTDMNGKFTMVSLSGARLVGLESPDQMIGRDVADRYANSDDRKAFLEALKENGSVHNYPITLKAEDGTIRHVTSSSHFFYDAEGVVQGVEGVIHDMTDLLRAEEALQYTNTILASQMETTIDGILVVDGSGKIISYNQQFVNICGITPDLIALRSDERALQSVLDMLVDPDEFLSRISYLYTHREEKSREEIRLRDMRTLERYSAPMIGRDGTYYGRIWYFRDITERKRAEEALGIASKRLLSVVESTGDVIAMMDAEYRYTLFNTAFHEEFRKIFGMDLKPGDFMPRALADLPEDLAHAMEYWNRALEGEDFTISQQFGDVLRERNWYELHFSPIRDSDGKVVGAMHIVRNITERKLAEDKLFKILQERQIILDNANIGIFFLIDRKPIWINRKTEAIFQYAKEELEGQTTRKLYPSQESYEQLDRVAYPVIAQGHTYETEQKLIRSDGTPIWVRCNGKAIEPSDLSKGTIWLLEDITVRKQTEEKLLSLSDRLSLATRAGGVGIWDYDIVSNALTWDDQMFVLYGITREQFGGAYEAWQAGLHPDDRMRGDEEIQQALRGEKEFNTVFRVLWPDGSTHYIRALGLVQRDSDGKPLRMIGTNWDITEQKKAEDGLRRSEEKFRHLIENSHDIIYTITTEGIFTFVSPGWTALLGHPVEMAVGRSIRQFIHPDDLPACLAFLQKMIRTAERQTGLMYRIRHADGTWRWHTSNAVPLKDKSGTVIAFEGSSSDITERKLAEEALTLASKKLTLLSSITRHDINNQLTVLLGYLTIMENKQTDPTFNNYFGKVSTAAQRISSMIQFTKEYESIGIKAPTWQDCRTLVDTAAKEAPLGTVMVKNDLPVGAEVFDDPLLIKVFYNLMDNAVRYGGKITTIRFSVEKSGDDHVIICQDDGEGVVAGEKEKIFERGFGKNTGMGLALSKEILAITGILIRETGEPGKGARFEMTVPKGMWRITGKGA